MSNPRGEGSAQMFVGLGAVIQGLLLGTGLAMALCRIAGFSAGWQIFRYQAF